MFERAILNPPKVSALLTQFHEDTASLFKDTYLLDFLDLPEKHDEADLQHALIANLRRFLLELGVIFPLSAKNICCKSAVKIFALISSSIIVSCNAWLLLN